MLSEDTLLCIKIDHATPPGLDKTLTNGCILNSRPVIDEHGDDTNYLATWEDISAHEEAWTNLSVRFSFEESLISHTYLPAATIHLLHFVMQKVIGWCII